MPLASVFVSIPRMYMVQLAVEGLATLPERTRIGFRGHLDILRVASPEGRAALVDVLFHTLFPDAERSEATLGLIDPRAERHRALLTVAGKDRVPYRLMRDLRSGRCRLYRFDKQGGHHQLLTETASEAQQFLRVQQQLPDDASYERLFLFTPDTRASAGPDARSRVGNLRSGLGSIPPSGPGLGLSGLGSALPSGLPETRGELTAMFPLPSLLSESTGAHPVVPSGYSMHNALVQQELEVSSTLDMVVDDSPDQLEARRRQAAQDLAQAQRARELEEELDRMAQREEEVRRHAARFQQIDTRRAELTVRVASARTLLGAPEALLQRLERYDRMDAHYRAELEAIDREAELLNERVTAAPDPRARAYGPVGIGAGVAAGAAAVAALLLREPSVLLAQIVLGTAAGWAGLRRLDHDEGRVDAEAALARNEERRALTLRNHSVETSTVRGLVERAEVEDPSALRAMVEALQQDEEHLVDAEASLDSEEGRRGRKANAVLAELAARRSRLEAELEGLHAAGVPDVASAQRRLDALQGPSAPASGLHDLELSLEEDDEPPVGSGGYDLAPASHETWWASSGFGGGGPARGGFGGYDGGGMHPLEARVRSLLESARDLVGAAADPFADSASERGSRYVRALTGGRYDRIELDGLGRCTVGGRGGRVAFASLEGDELDRVDAALRLGLVECILRVRQIPVLLQEPFAPLSPDRRKVVKQIYAHLASLSQLVVLTPADDLEGNVVPVR